MFLKIPIDAVPSFQTAFITVEWKVYFEFLTSPEGQSKSSPNTEASEAANHDNDPATSGHVQQVSKEELCW